MQLIPIFIDVAGRLALVVGGGETAARRVAMITGAGGHVRAVAEDTCPAFVAAVEHEYAEHLARPFEDDDLEDCEIVFVSIDDDALNARVSALARERRVPVNVTDNPALCTFTMPAVVDRSPIRIAVSSGAQAPILTRLVRSRIESFIPAALGRLAQQASEWRDRIKAAIPDPVRRRRFWEDWADGAIAEEVLSGRADSAERMLADALAKAAAEGGQPPPGEVYLVGAGPGDPDLLTFRALRLMQRADVVLHDRLVPDDVLRLVRHDAERVFVGKQSGDHPVPQDEIIRRMVSLAKAGKRVLRLKGGDPFMFGRGGEEISTLSAEGIPFQVVPGVTAAAGAATYAGIPLTHRDHAHSCVFVTGHMRDGEVELDWKTLAEPKQTVVVYMALGALAQVTEKLIAGGADPATPAAVIDNATRPTQRVIAGVLRDLATKAEDAALEGPAIVIVGEVVRLRDKLSWFHPPGEEGGDQGGEA